jgi:anti-anti-sigma factor
MNQTQGEPTVTAQQRAVAECEVMLELQRAMLPVGLPVLPDLSLAAGYRPASIASAAGGDWYDVVALPGHAIGLVVGDVVGHGATASAVMGQLRAVAAERLRRGDELVEVARAVDDFTAGMPAARGGSLCLAVLDRETGSIRYVRRGHPPPLVVTASGGSRFLSGSGGPPLGMPGGNEPAGEGVLAPGDTLVLYTNGAAQRRGNTLTEGLGELANCVTEVLRHNQFGERRLTEQICAALTDTDRADDVIVLAVTMLTDPPESICMVVPATADQIGVIRKRFSSWLDEFRPGEDDLVALELSVVEAVTNSVEHAFPGPPGIVRVEASLHRDGTVSVVVSDDGRWKVPDEDPGYRGRGLLMMREFSDQVWLHTSPQGTTVTLAKALHRPMPTNSGAVPSVVAAEGAEFDIAVRVEPTGVLMSLAGALDSANVDALHSALLDVSRRGSLRLTIVLDEVTMLASAGLRLLYEVAGYLMATERTLLLVAAEHSPARDVLAVSGLDRLVEVVPRLA